MDGASGHGVGSTVTHTPRRLRLAAWVLAVLAYGLADGITTLALLRTPAVLERNPLVVAAYDGYGSLGVAAVKVGALATCYVLSRYVDDAETEVPLVPLFLGVVGAALALNNLLLL